MTQSRGNRSMHCAWLALLPLIAAQSELCPEVATSKPCSASQDFVFVVDASFSRLEYHEDFQEFVRRFAGGLDLTLTDGHPMPCRGMGLRMAHTAATRKSTLRGRGASR